MFRPGRYPPGRWAVETWNVAFLGYPARNAWDLFSPAECRHMVAWGWAERAQVWMYCNPAFRAEGLLACPDAEVEDLLIADCVDLATAVLVRQRGPRTPTRPRLFTTCATIVADVIGFPSRALRPIALYRELLSDPETETVHGLQPARHAGKPTPRPARG